MIKQPSKTNLDVQAARPGATGETDAKPPRNRHGGIGKAPIAPGTPDTDGGKGLPLPHERDESSQSTSNAIDPRIAQAARDIASGQVDTDMHGTPGLDAEQRAKLLRRP